MDLGTHVLHVPSVCHPCPACMQHWRRIEETWSNIRCSEARRLRIWSDGSRSARLKILNVGLRSSSSLLRCLEAWRWCRSSVDWNSGWIHGFARCRRYLPVSLVQKRELFDRLEMSHNAADLYARVREMLPKVLL